jgi:hypothetical protein
MFDGPYHYNSASKGVPANPVVARLRGGPFGKASYVPQCSIKVADYL